MSEGVEDLVSVVNARAVMSQRLFNRLIFAVMGAGLLVLIGLASAAFWLSARSRDYAHWVDHTYVAQSQIIAFQAQLEQAETSRRGYLLSPNPIQLARYAEFRQNLSTALYALANTTKDNPAQVANVAKLRPLLNWKIRANDSSIAMTRAGHQAMAIRAFIAEQNFQPLNGLRVIVGEMMAQEQILLKQRAAREQANTDLLSLVTITGAGVLALLAIGSILVMRRYGDDLQRAQAQLKGLNEELEQRVLRRTEDLTRANEEIQRFAYIVSHDLRSPLVNMMGFTSELEEGLKPIKALVGGVSPRDLPEPVRRAVEEDLPEAISFIRVATRKMDRLINAILKLSREGRRNLFPEPLAMKVLIEGLIDSVHHQLDAKGATAEIEGDLFTLVSDRVAVEQVLGNLIDNAVKYLSPKRPGRIVVRGHRVGERVMIEVQDNGRGVDPRDHERIFELFRRSGPQDQPGEGIGLAHVRALVYRLGGTITCISDLDQGSTFRLSLPRILSHKEGMAA